MPRYLYKCDTCNAVVSRSFPMNDIPKYLSCSSTCGQTMHRQYTFPQLITQPTHLQDQWRLDESVDGPDGVKARKEQDRKYEESWKPKSDQEIEADHLTRMEAEGGIYA